LHEVVAYVLRISEMPGREQSMRRALRKSIPFVQAALIGTLAAVALAGVALLISHS